MQRTLRGHRRIDLAHRTCRRVPRVDEELAPGLLLPCVQGGEIAPRHVHLAADFEHRGGMSTAQPVRDCPDRAHVRRDVLADLAVAAGGRDGKPPVFVADADREAVELELGQVLHRRCVRRTAPDRAGHARRTSPRRRPSCRSPCGSTASARRAAPERNRSAARRPRAAWANPRPRARGTAPRAPAARETARRTRRRKLSARRGRSNGGRAGQSRGAAPPRAPPSPAVRHRRSCRSRRSRPSSPRSRHDRAQPPNSANARGLPGSMWTWRMAAAVLRTCSRIALSAPSSSSRRLSSTSIASSVCAMRRAASFI